MTNLKTRPVDLVELESFLKRKPADPGPSDSHGEDQECSGRWMWRNHVVDKCSGYCVAEAFPGISSPDFTLGCREALVPCPS